jgi:outer membrane protein
MLKTATLLFFAISYASFAASISLPELESLALTKNKGYLASNQELESAKAKRKSGFSAFLPHISLNGGWENTKKFDDNNKGYLGYLDGNWSLYRGGKDAAELKNYNLGLELQISKVEQSKRQVISAVRKLYFKILTSQRLLTLVQEEQKINNEQKLMADKKVSAGLTSEVDKLEFELREQQILAELNKYQSDLTKDRAALSSELGGLENNILFVDNLDNTPLLKNFEIQNSVASASIKLRESQLAALSAEVNKKIALSSFLPELTFSASYGRLTPRQTSFASDRSESSYTLLLSVPLFSGFSNYQSYVATNHSVAAKENEEFQTRLNIESEQKIFATDFLQLRTLYELNQQRLVKTAKYYNLTIGEYRRGVKNSPDLVSATENMFEARKKEIEYLRDAHVLSAVAYEQFGIQ